MENGICKIARLGVVMVGLWMLLQPSYSQSSNTPKREFRATWIATVSRIDWPKTVASSASASQIQSQKNELVAILNALEAGHLNATFLQVRPNSDAFYQSSREPWSQWLTGTRGKNPGWDPLAFAVEEAHKRGIELHVWINPYRYEINGQHNTYAASDPIRRDHPDWILDFNNGSFDGTLLDPGNPAVRQYVTEVIAEIVNNYDIDGVVFDDYFYPYGGTTTEDAATVAAYKPATQDVKDWRRENVDKTVKMVYDTIQTLKPWVRFGIGPFGIWSTSSAAAKKYGISLPSGIVGTDAYNALYCNTLEWMKQGTVDYVSPQLYWSTESTGQDYDVLSKWWSDMAKHFTDKLVGNKQVHLFPSVAAYRYTASEMCLEVNDNRRFDQLDAPGVVFYNTTYYRQLANGITSGVMPGKALHPAMFWKNTPALAAPTNVKLTGSKLTWSHSSNATRFAVYVYPKGTDPEMSTSGQYLHQIVYGKELDLSDVADLSNKTIAVAAYDRYGNEFTATFLNKAANEEVDTIAVHVTGINLRLKTHSMRVGTTIQLTPTVSPSNATNKDVVWTTSDANVITVSESGLVTAIGNGTAVATATTVDGGFTASCTFTITGGQSGLDDVLPSESHRLKMENGVLMIETNDGLFTIDGRRVR